MHEQQDPDWGWEWLGDDGHRLTQSGHLCRVWREGRVWFWKITCGDEFVLAGRTKSREEAVRYCTVP
jgi:hypothetical protein